MTGDDLLALFVSRSAVVGVVGGADAAADGQAVRLHQVHREQPGWPRHAAASRFFRQRLMRDASPAANSSCSRNRFWIR